MAVDFDKLSELTPDELDTLFRNSPAGDIPDGEANGEVLIPPAAGPLDEIVEKLVHLIVFRGEIFDREKGELVNVVTPLRLKLFRAKVFKGTSLFDKKESIILDYSKTTLIPQWDRDEIREVAPGLYLGLVFFDKKPVLHYALQFAA